MRASLASPDSEQRTLRLLPGPSDLARDVAHFLLDRQAQGLSPRTVDFHAEKLRHLTRWLDGQRVARVEDVTADHLRAWLVFEAKRRNAGGVRTLWVAASAFLRWWEVENEPANWRNPVRRVKPPRVSLDPLPPVPLDDVRAMLRTCAGRTFEDLRDAAMLLALLDTGARASEFVGLRVGDVDPQSGAVTIRRGKGGKGRTCFLGKRARLRLARYLRGRGTARPSDSLWAKRSGEGLTTWGLRQVLRRRAERVKIPVPGAHAFRRAFALNTLRAGADAVSVARLLGHADLSVVSRYLAQTKADLAEVAERTAPGDRV